MQIHWRSIFLYTQNNWKRLEPQYFRITPQTTRLPTNKAFRIKFFPLITNSPEWPGPGITKRSLQFRFSYLYERNDSYKERELENALTDNITKFLIELGAGFAYVGRQIPLKVGNKEFYLDLLFYHLKLRCYIVIELKATDFIPEYTGKLSFYLTAVNDLLKHQTDNPTIGLLICKNKDSFIAEYSLKGISQPIGVSEYELTRLCPEDFKGSLPSIEEIEAELKE